MKMRMKNVLQQHELWKEVHRTCQRGAARLAGTPTSPPRSPHFHREYNAGANNAAGDRMISGSPQQSRLRQSSGAWWAVVEGRGIRSDSHRAEVPE